MSAARSWQRGLAPALHGAEPRAARPAPELVRWELVLAAAEQALLARLDRPPNELCARLSALAEVQRACPRTDCTA